MKYNLKEISEKLNPILEGAKGKEVLSKRTISDWIKNTVKRINGKDLDPTSFELFTNICYESCKLKGQLEETSLKQLLPLILWVASNTLNELGKEQ